MTATGNERGDTRETAIGGSGIEMFTGLVEAIGTIEGTAEIPSGRRLSVRIPSTLGQPGIGDSIAVNGCCLTVVSSSPSSTDFEVGPETIRKTNLGLLEAGDPVNLERSLPVGGRLGGHIVQGHIDGVGRVRSRQKEGDWDIVWFECGDLATSMVPKGSVAVDGVSLTVCEVEGDAFRVMLIPHTLDHTTLCAREPGSKVNIETDILGKYILRFLSQMFPDGTPLTLERRHAAEATK